MALTSQIFVVSVNPVTRVSNGSGAVQICINLVKTVAPGWRQIESEMALDLNTIPAVSALLLTSIIKSTTDRPTDMTFVFLL